MPKRTVRAFATAAKVGSTVVASIGGISTTINVARDLAIVSGDGLIVELNPNGEWWAVGRSGTAVIPDPIDVPTAPPPPKPTTVNGNQVIAAYETRSRQGTKWRTDNDDVYQGQYGGNGNHTGCVFYNKRFSGLLGSTVTSAELIVRRPDRGGWNNAQPTTMRLMTDKTRPSGAPTLTSSTAGPSLRRGQTVSNFSVPTSWAQSLVDGTAGGLAFFESDGDPYVILSGRGDYSAAFSMRVYWTRSN